MGRNILSGSDMADLRKMKVAYICSFVSSIDRQIYLAGQLLFDVWGFSWGWAGLGHWSTNSPGSIGASMF